MGRASVSRVAIHKVSTPCFRRYASELSDPTTISPLANAQGTTPRHRPEDSGVRERSLVTRRIRSISLGERYRIGDQRAARRETRQYALVFRWRRRVERKMLAG